MPTVLYISPGPTYDPRSPDYQQFWHALSQRYEGHILTTAPRNETVTLGRFVLHAMESRNTPLDSLRFVFFCLAKSIGLRNRHGRVDLVTTYDPLKTGLIGLMVARVHRARFAPQVRGVYTSEAVWIDQGNSIGNRVKRRLVPAIMRFVLRRADGVKLLFNEQLAPFREILAGKVIEAFPSSVSTEAFKSIGEEKQVLFVGFPFRLKGTDLLIQAFKSVAPRYPDWTLKILAWAPDPLELEAAIGEHPQIHHHPPVKHSEMPEHIGRCAILVLPSRSEAMGRVLVEAMAAEKPRIGSRVDGIPTVINDGVDGYLVRPGDVDDLAQKLDTLMGNPELRRSMGRAGKARIPVEFAQEVHVRRLCAFFDRVIAGTGTADTEG